MLQILSMIGQVINGIVINGGQVIDGWRWCFEEEMMDDYTAMVELLYTRAWGSDSGPHFIAVFHRLN